MENSSPITREWPTRVALILQALTMGIILAVILTFLVL